jgi:site-specific DNA-methyltransferase (adenine-specific)
MELNKIYQGDCMDYMKDIPDGFFELAIVDPPYGININMNMGRRASKRKMHSEKKWDGSIPEGIYFNELFRVSRNQIIWGGNYFSLPITKSWIFWDKAVPEGVSFADGELGWTSFDKTLVKAKIKYSGFQGMDGRKIHPTQKPITLYKWLLRNYAKEGDKILDTHLGSASSIIACIDMGFDFMGIELDEEYYSKALQRINNHLRQGDLTRDIKFQNLQLSLA